MRADEQTSPRALPAALSSGLEKRRRKKRWRRTFLETSWEAYDRMQDVNVRAPFFLVQAAARRMIELRTEGRIVVVTSRSWLRPRAGASAYAISKAAQYALVRSAAIELAPHGIAVNEVAPGSIETDMNQSLRASPEALRSLVDSHLFKRLGRPEEVAAAVLFLVSSNSSFTTGATISVDGGGATA